MAEIKDSPQSGMSATVTPDMRDQIWAALVNTKFKGYCLDLLVEKFQKRDRNINIFLAVASSGSIATWAVWREYPFIWATIIAVSQILTTIKPFLPFYKFVKEINEKSGRVDNIFIEYERLWHKVNHKKISDDEDAERFFELRQETESTLNFSDDTVFDVTKEMEKKADVKTANYIFNNYRVKIELSEQTKN